MLRRGSWPLLLGARKLLGAPGRTTRSKDATKGLLAATTRSKDAATRGLLAVLLGARMLLYRGSWPLLLGARMLLLGTRSYEGLLLGARMLRTGLLASLRT